jgi:prepilin-type N-terminal cleavage/methylation domain-containing protein
VSASRRSAGFTLLELVIVICLVGIFAAVALDRFFRYQEIAEKTAMEATLGAMRSGLTLQVAARIPRGGFAALEGLAEENPVDWLAKAPPGYLGALHDPAPGKIPSGSWYFDLKNNELVYTPQRTRYLVPDTGEANGIHFRVVLRIAQNDRSGVRELAELDLRPTRPVRWSPEF